MSFKKFILKSSFRKKSKVIYQLSGLSIPILIILFFAISSQMNYNLKQKFAPDSDIQIIGDPNSHINESLMSEIREDNRVENVIGMFDYYPRNASGLVVLGVDSSDTDFMKMYLSSGRKFDNNEKEIVLSDYITDQLNKTVGDYISLENIDYKIVGIVKNPFYLGRSYTSLKNAQELSALQANESIDYNHGYVEEIFIKTKKGENNTKIVEDLKNKYNNRSDVDNGVMGPEESGENSRKYLEKMERIIFIVVPMVIGILLTLIIMMKSVGDRTREIGVLKAIGWKSKRIFTLILTETFILSIFSFILASIVAILVTFAMNLMNPYLPLGFFEFLETLSVSTFLEAFVVVIVMALVGSLVPAIRASRLSPAEAVREE
ncbi:MAG: FtsX-like permease family protein [Methanobrevibacter sp.]|jgi:putative ABC transport system permease protein|nr:FtsX-like permease family protein [Candidatus Methanovirga australis]